MVILDVNVLVYAIRPDLPEHGKAIRYLSELDLEMETLGWHPAISAAMIRVVTSKHVFTTPSSLGVCNAFLSTLTTNPRATKVTESERFWQTFTNLLDKYNIRGPAVSDCYWAALAIDQGAILCSADKKFGLIKELRWHNLLG